MDSNWIVVYETEDELKAEIIKGMLIENEINAVVVNKKDYAYRFGFYEVCVHKDDVMKAKTLIINFDN